MIVMQVHGACSLVPCWRDSMCVSKRYRQLDWACMSSRQFHGVVDLELKYNTVFQKG